MAEAREILSDDSLARSLVHACRLSARTARKRFRKARLHAAAPDTFTLRGVSLHLDEDWVTPSIRESIYNEWYEESEATIVAATVGREDRVLEIGCGVGFIATIASRIVDNAVRCYEADPKMAAAARRTIERNAAGATVTNAVLATDPAAPTTDFYVHPDFWLSSLAPHPDATRIDVPLLDLATEIAEHDASYLIVDIEGAETELLAKPLPASIRKICVECHPAVSDRDDVRALLSSLLDQGFALDLVVSVPPVLFLDR